MQSMGLGFLDALAAEGRREFSAEEARTRLGRSPQATTNTLTRLVRDGWIERARRGKFLIRNLGQLGVAAESREELGALISAASGDRQSRIAYATALQEHDLLVRPWKPIQFAVDRRLFVTHQGARPFEPHIEHAARLEIGAIPHGPTTISRVERALLESAERPRHVGGITTVAEALSLAGDVDHDRLAQLANELGYSVGLRRLVSMDRLLDLDRLAGVVMSPVEVRTIPLDPGDPRKDGPHDKELGVRWPGPLSELQSVIAQ